MRERMRESGGGGERGGERERGRTRERERPRVVGGGDRANLEK